MSKPDFLAGVSAGHFLEHASVHGNCYGTSRAAVERVASEGRCCVLDIDVQGARSVGASGLPAVFAFVAPPSLGELEARLRGRGTEDGAAVERRLAAARGEIESLSDDPGLWDFVIVNDDFAEASAQLASVARRALAGLTGNGTRGGEEGEEGGAGGGGGQAKEKKKGQQPEREEVMTPNGTTSLAAFAASNGAAAAAAGKVLGSSSSSDGGGKNGPAAAGGGAGAASAVAGAAPAASSPPSSSSASRSWPTGFSASHCLEGRVVAVTGASAGIGRALCLQLAALPGVRVVGLARRGDRLEELADEIKKQHLERVTSSSSSSSSSQLPPPEFLPVICDVTREGEVAALPKIVRARWGDKAGIDVLINNAGMSRHDSALLDGNPAAWAAMLNVNVLAPALLTRVVVADLRERIAKEKEENEAAKNKKKGGSKKAASSNETTQAEDGAAASLAPSHARPAHVVNVSSMMAYRVYVYPGCGGLYSATKHALRAMTEGLRLEARAAGLPLRVSLVSPGRVATEFFAAMHDGQLPQAFPPAVDGSPGPAPAMTPEDVAGAVLFVLAAPPGVDVNDVLMRPVGQTV